MGIKDYKLIDDGTIFIIAIIVWAIWVTVMLNMMARAVK